MPIRFGRYLLLRRKSIESIGENFLALWGVDEGIDQLRIIRAIYPSVAEDADFVALFSEESRSLSQLSSSNVVRILEVGEESGIPFVTQEHVEGLTLERLLNLATASETQCHWELAVHVVSEILRGLDYIHRREDVRGVPLAMRHGDIRPQNVLISFNGEVKLTNFSSSLYYIIDQKTNARFETERGIYAPPESKTTSKGATVAGDLWGTAMVMLAMLKGPSVIKAIREQQDTSASLPSLAFQVEGIPKRLNLFLARTLHPDAKYRFKTALDMREALLEIIREHATGHPPDDLAAFALALGSQDREEEEAFVRTMLKREASISLDESADMGKMTPGVVLDGKYHLLRLLGEGGMGQVFEAEHLGLEKRVAVKVLHERVLHDAVAIERFRREARIMGGLGHPNIVEVLDYGVTEEGNHYLAMTLLDGVTLGEKIAEEGAVPPRELVEIMIAVCHGLAAAHNAGVVHRDLKPDNIFLTGKGPRIVDFGIAKRADLEEQETSLTRTGNICGTVEYIAPEQLRGRSIDHRVDIYTVGLIMYEGLTGHTPFKGRNIAETMHRVMTDKVVSPRKRTANAAIPKVVEDICLKAMDRDPDKRFQRVEAMAEAMERIQPLFDEDVLGRPRHEVRHRNISIAVAVVALLGILGMILLLIRLPKDRGIAEVPASIEKPASVLLGHNNPKENSAPLTKGVTGSDPPTDSTKPKSKPSAASDPETTGSGSNETTPISDPNRVAVREDVGAKVNILIKQADDAMRGGKFAQAGKLYQEAARINPAESKAWYGQGRATFEQGQPGKAVQSLKRALRLAPGRHDWRIYLGKVQMSAGQREEAVKEWKRVLKSRPTDAIVIDLLEQVGEHVPKKSQLSSN
jgi:eukaryotic-like serine/threonine-protein kinase